MIRRRHTPGAHVRAGRRAIVAVLGALLLGFVPTAVCHADALDDGFDHFEAGRYADALAVFDQLGAEHPDSAIPPFYAGLAATFLDDSRAAIVRFRIAAEREPDLPELQLRLGIALYWEGEIDAAEEHLLSALVQGPETGELLYHLALIDLERGEEVRAHRLFDEAAALDPTLRAPADAEITYHATGDIPAPAEAWAPPDWFAASAGAGFEWDDDLVVPETLVATGQSDIAGVFDLSLDVFPVLRQNGEFGLGYDFYQSVYQDVTSLNSQTHTVRGGGSLLLGRYRMRSGYGFTHQRLGQSPYLNAHRLGGGVEARLLQRWFADLSLGFEYQDFADFSDRDALRWSIGFGQRIELFGGRVSTFFAYVPEWQEARAERLDYFAHRFDLRTHVELGRRGSGVFVRAGYAFEGRNYDHVEPLLVDQEREDRIHLARAGLTLPLIWHVEATFDYTFVSSRSNLDFLDYDENVVTLRTGVWF